VKVNSSHEKEQKSKNDCLRNKETKKRRLRFVSKIKNSCSEDVQPILRKSLSRALRKRKRFCFCGGTQFGTKFDLARLGYLTKKILNCGGV
jgi:hypothetical protein